MPTLLHGDCLELMKTLPDKSVDLFLCDLPYGCLSGRAIGKTAEAKKVWSGDAMGCAWDIPIDLAQFWTEVKRLCRDDHTPVLMFCSTKFGFDLYNSNPDWFRYDLVWEKTNAVGFLSANKMPMRSHEMVYVFAKKGATYYRTDITGDFPASHMSTHKRSETSNCVPRVADYGTLTGSVYDISNERRTTPLQRVPVREGIRCVKSVITIPNKKGKGKHPTQKPADLYEWLITRYSKEGDTILDPTAGSFASVFTAERLGRTAIGIEKDDGFYAKALTHCPNPS